MSKNKGKSVNDAVLEYLKKQNRPYSAIDVFNNLHKEHGKTAVVKCLESLAEKNEIKEKVYGKQKIYYADQDRMESLDEKQIAKMDQDISETTSVLKGLQGEVKSKETLLASLKNSLTDEQIRNKLEELRKENGEMETRLKELKCRSKDVPPEAKEKIARENESALKEWRKRKRMACDILETVLEGYPKGKKALLEEIGVETDEDADVSYPGTTGSA
ncbi:homologous-pairing protein 2 homolog [Centruroides vittatus]|uniref:homologous-pairing protein 2 homolog n=1 Tax=Centruroides vittatus TaxID=120091 RepID=UPI0035102059